MSNADLFQSWAQTVGAVDVHDGLQTVEHMLKHERDDLTETEIQALERAKPMIEAFVKEMEYENAFEAGPWC